MSAAVYSFFKWCLNFVNSTRFIYNDTELAEKPNPAKLRPPGVR